MKTGGLFLFILLLGMNSAHTQAKTDAWFNRLLRKNASPLLQEILNHKDTFRYQLIYTRIDRDKRNRPRFKNYYLNLDKDLYFYPASMVKLPTALTALEKMNHLRSRGIDRFTPMLTDSSHSGQTAVTADSTAANGLPSLDHYLRKIFLVSDNDAYNRLYEFCGQQYLNETLWSKGYTDMRITRRFTSMTPEENRFTNQIRFLKEEKLIYTQPPAEGRADFDFSRPVLIGNAHYDRNEQLVQAPYDFTRHNKATLSDLQLMMQGLLFPASVPASRHFDLTADDYASLYRYMSERISESRFPEYDPVAFFDSYTKFFFFRDGQQPIPPYIRSFNKTGWSHGFLTDVCYIVDFKNQVEFMLSGTIYVNADGILNDNKYEYLEKGYPFFREVGEKIYQYELARTRKHRPDLSQWQLSYD
ncbi:hypothetical protein GCM10027051_18820 [Niabella terrae]